MIAPINRVIGDTLFRIIPSGGVFPEAWASIFPHCETIFHSNIRTVEINVDVRCTDWKNLNSKGELRRQRSVYRDETTNSIIIDEIDYTAEIYRCSNGLVCRSIAAGESNYALKAMLLAIVALDSADRQRLLVHASLVQHQDSGNWVFAGASGSGKTTIATELLGNGSALSTDRVILGVTNGRVVAHDTPFSNPPDLTPESGPVAVDGIAFIRQEKRHQVKTLSKEEALGQLLHHCTLFRSIDGYFDQQLQSAVSVCETAELQTLSFAKNPGFWRLLKKGTK